MSDMIKAFVIDSIDGKVESRLKEISRADLPDEPILVQVAYSTVNFKDGLALTGVAPIAQKTPMVGGIDLAGTIVESASPEWKPGERVVINGWGLSQQHWGGYAQFQRVRPEWLVRLPDTFSLTQAMAIGTAGYTAMLCVLALERMGVKPGRDVLVTGAAGGVGSVAVALLAKLGYKVAASTGRPETHDYLRGLGASAVIDRSSLSSPGAPVQDERWAGAIDTIGGHALANVLAQTAYGGAIAACGLASSRDLPASILPFVLRGIALQGIDSVMAPKAAREEAWLRLAADLDPRKLDAMTSIAPMSELTELATRILAGDIRGRTVIDVNA
ncbi:oxidoreductase [Bradyrhizobium manausense]|uniref:acrylyl-CoA reductase (NADPH) n=1 Tax=Bradyrhizobium TaxID=374 RepID=UPI001BAD4D74|nr:MULTISPECIES: MDR family oxidoreductase [Bradyrhizobium]MBR0826611.1 oxidoreductase [Bradyrhizobium manausense]UVO29000.1 oxidoreductase [Bradyrhizobium arachidis]